MAISKTKLSQFQEQLEQERRMVSFDSYDLTVRQLLDMYESGDVFIPPEYQRQFVWNESRQSQLIESVFLGIPVPSLFMATNADSTWEVVDGVQRISTLAHFVGGEGVLAKVKRDSSLKIKELEKLYALDQVAFSDLPKSIQLMFYTRPLRVTVLNDKSDLNVRFDLFERLNTGGVSLTAQEIRNCVFRGDFNEDIKKLADSPSYQETIRLKPLDKSNGTKEELILRFFAFYEQYEDFDHSVKDFLNAYMRVNSRKKLSEKLMKVFDATFTFLAKELPSGIIRGNRQITPVNLFEAIAVGTALALKETTNIKTNVVVKLLNDPELRKFTTGATNSKRMVKSRIDYVKDALI